MKNPRRLLGCCLLVALLLLAQGAMAEVPRGWESRAEEGAWENDFLVQNQRYGYQPEMILPYPPPPLMIHPEEGERFFLDRFGRRLKVYRAKPYRPGVEGYDPGWSGPVPEVPVMPPANQDPLGALRGPGEVPRALPFPQEGNRYSLGGDPEMLPDLSQYPKPPEDRDWRNEPLLRRTEPAGPELTPVPREQWPPVVRRPEPTMPPAFPERRAPPVAPQMPAERGAVPREEPVFPPRIDVPPAMPERPAAPSPPPPPPDPYAHLPYGKPVAKKKGFVTLEEHPNLPEIDVRGIAPGTPVEFPDPRDPSQIIQFRVPKPE